MALNSEWTDGEGFLEEVTLAMNLQEQGAWSSHCGIAGWEVSLQHQDRRAIPGWAQWVKGSGIAAAPA